MQTGEVGPASRAALAYDVVAQTYEARFVDELDDKPGDRALLDRFAAGVSGLVLDLGCGPGQIGRYVQDCGRDVVGADISRGMAARAATRLAGAVVADMRRLPFRNRSLGGVVAFYSLIHLPRGELAAVLRELEAVLRPEGRLVVSAHEGVGEVEVHDFLGHDVDLAASFFDLDELEEAATRAGFRVARSERRPPYANEGTTVRLYVELVAGSPGERTHS